MGKKAIKRRSNKTNILPIHTNQPVKPSSVSIIPKNVNQETYMLDLLNPSRDIVIGVGPAGTGKTMLAVQVAIKLFKEKVVDKIIVTRPVVSVDEDIGFLPGTLEEKMAPWTIPIFDVFKMYYNTNDIRNMMYEGIIEMAPLAYMRGRTFKKSIIVADEMQNASANQMKMLLTRIGDRSKIVVTGDLEQTDRPNRNGLSDFVNRFPHKKQSDRISMVHFNYKDVVRHRVVSEVLDIYN
jgi:phosphate starvation-inducible PhoH-like protein